MYGAAWDDERSALPSLLRAHPPVLRLNGGACHAAALNEAVVAREGNAKRRATARRSFQFYRGIEQLAQALYDRKPNALTGNGRRRRDRRFRGQGGVLRRS